jgi:hypothetical protein
MLQNPSDRCCPDCQSPIALARARGSRENMAFVLGSDIRRCLSCSARFICFRQLTIRGADVNNGDDPDFGIAWLAIFSGATICLGTALWTLRTLHRFHRWPF